MHDKRYLSRIHVIYNYNRFFNIANFDKLLKKSWILILLSNINYKENIFNK